MRRDVFDRLYEYKARQGIPTWEAALESLLAEREQHRALMKTENGTQLVDKVAQAVLYEGYILYPYRASAVKNRQRFNFGGLYPPAFSRMQAGTDACAMQTECLVWATSQATVSVRVRFLHLLTRQIGRLTATSSDLPAEGDPGCQEVAALEVDGRLYQTWQEAAEREVALPDLPVTEFADRPHRQTFSLPASCHREPLRDARGDVVGVVTRRHQPLEGAVEVSAEQIEQSLFRLRVVIGNETPLAEAASREQALLQSLASTHAILNVQQAEFISLLEPAEPFRQAAAGCRNVGCWPVLVGEPGQVDTVLASPIILYDYPQIAPESSGDLFDGTEIDEILMLRIMTLTDEEKREMRSTDERAGEILDRTELLPPEQWMKLHGALRALRPAGETAP